MRILGIPTQLSWTEELLVRESSMMLVWAREGVGVEGAVSVLSVSVSAELLAVML